jgi:hypothetical protein
VYVLLLRSSGTAVPEVVGSKKKKVSKRKRATTDDGAATGGEVAMRHRNVVSHVLYSGSTSSGASDSSKEKSYAVARYLVVSS